jgi:hypothetical protein
MNKMFGKLLFFLLTLNVITRSRCSYLNYFFKPG